MTKQALIEKMAGDARIKKAAAKRALASFEDAVSGTVKNGDRLILTGFGTFSVVNRKERTGRNPQTGEKVNIPASRVPKFSPAAAFKQEIN